MAIFKGLKAVTAIYQGKPIRGVYRRPVGTFTAKKGMVKIKLPDYEYVLRFTVGGHPYNSVFGRESEHGKIGATGKWESTAVADAVEALVRFRANAIRGVGPTSILEEQELARRKAEEERRREQQRLTLRDLAELWLGSLTLAPDVAADTKKKPPKAQKNRPRTIQEYRRNLERDILPFIGGHIATEVTRLDISRLIDKIADRGAFTQANRTLAAITRLYYWAQTKGLVEQSYHPCARMEKYREASRKRVLTEPESKEVTEELPTHPEIKKLWKCLENEVHRDEEQSKILRLALLLGSRPGEICSMCWEEIGEDNWWTLPPEKVKTGTSSKEEVDLECYLTPTARALIGEKQVGQTGPVFSKITKPDEALPEDRLSKYVREQNDYFGLEAWQPRDLRRTFATLAGGLEIEERVVDRGQARAPKSILQKVYDKHTYYSKMRELFDAIEKEILRVTQDEPSPSHGAEAEGPSRQAAKVIPLRRA